MRRIAFVLVAMIALLGGSVAGALASAKGGVPSNFRRHEDHYWVWYAPCDWVSASGANGIDITSPVGDDYVGFGFSAAPCPGRAQGRHRGSR